MNKIKKTIAIILCLILAAGSMAFAEETQQAGAKDYEGHWAQATIQKWMDAGRVSGYPDGSYKPDANVTRAEFVKLVNGTIDYNAAGVLSYNDVTVNDWFYDYVGIAQEIGYISGYSADKFGPNDYITREQAASILARIQYLNGNAAAAGKFNDKNSISSWAVEAVGAASDAGFISGYSDGTFMPSKKLTRAEALTMLDNMVSKSKNVVIYKAGTELKDKTVEGDLIIAKTVGEGDVHLTNIVMKGDIRVFGGGLNSIYFNNVKYVNVLVEKDNVRLVFPRGTVIIAGENAQGIIAQISITGDNEVTFTGNFTDIKIVGEVNIALNNADINKLTVEKTITVTGTGSIGTLQANADGIKYAPALTINETLTGSGVKTAPAPIAESTGGGGGGFAPDPEARISISASIDGKSYNPLMTTSAYTGKNNISLFLKSEIVDILGTYNTNINDIAGKINNRIGGMTINGISVNTVEGLGKIQDKLAGTFIVNGFDGIFSETDSTLSLTDIKAIINAYQYDDLKTFSLLDISKTVAYNGNDVEPVFKVNGVTKNREEMRSFLIDAARCTIDNFFATYGTTVNIEAVRGSRTATVTITRIDN